MAIIYDNDLRIDCGKQISVDAAYLFEFFRLLRSHHHKPFSSHFQPACHIWLKHWSTEKGANPLLTMHLVTLMLKLFVAIWLLSYSSSSGKIATDIVVGGDVTHATTSRRDQQKPFLSSRSTDVVDGDVPDDVCCVDGTIVVIGSYLLYHHFCR